MKSPHVESFDPVMLDSRCATSDQGSSSKSATLQHTKHAHTVTHRHTTTFQGTGSSPSSNSAVGCESKIILLSHTARKVQSSSHKEHKDSETQQIVELLLKSGVGKSESLGKPPGTYKKNCCDLLDKLLGFPGHFFFVKCSNGDRRPRCRTWTQGLTRGCKLTSCEVEKIASDK